MVVQIPSNLEAALSKEARQRGVSPEDLALEALSQRFPPQAVRIEPRDDWERRLFDAALDCGVGVPDSALSSDGLYE